MNTHTPGPWFTAKRGAAIANIIDFGCAEQVNQYETPNQEQAANARLIAAAPDLLKALVKLIDEVEYHSALRSHILPANTRRMNDARAAIAKATEATP